MSSIYGINYVCDFCHAEVIVWAPSRHDVGNVPGAQKNYPKNWTHEPSGPDACSQCATPIIEWRTALAAWHKRYNEVAGPAWRQAQDTVSAWTSENPGPKRPYGQKPAEPAEDTP